MGQRSNKQKVKSSKSFIFIQRRGQSLRDQNIKRAGDQKFKSSYSQKVNAYDANGQEVICQYINGQRSNGSRKTGQEVMGKK